MLIAESVLRGGAGMEAGLLLGDEIVALDGVRTISETVLDLALDGVRETVELIIARAGVTKRLLLAARPDPRPQIRLRIEQNSELGCRSLWRNE